MQFPINDKEGQNILTVKVPKLLLKYSEAALSEHIVQRFGGQYYRIDIISD